jgi:signal transduction histidine kinase/ligand-binding sensor domain-containing protein
MRIPSVAAWLLWLSACFITTGIMAQNSRNVPYGSQFNAFQWTETNGIPAMVQAMVQTHDGYLWIGNELGIFRFDGVKTTMFNRHTARELSEDDCSALYEARDSSLYCGLYNGLLVRYKNGRFEQIGTKADFHERTIKNIVEDKAGNLWIGTDGAGLIRYKNKQFTAFGKSEGLISKGIQCLVMGKEDEIWLGSEDGLFLLNNGKIKNIRPSDGQQDLDVSTLFYDGTEELWIGTNDGVIMTLKSGVFRHITELKPIAGSPVRAFHKSPDGKVWILTSEFGVIVFDPENATFSKISANTKLTEAIGMAILTNLEGDIIIGTQGANLFRLRKNFLKTYTTANGLTENSLMGIFRAPNGDVWIGSESGTVTCYRNGQFIDMTERFGTFGKPIFSIGSGNDNTVWVATFGELVGWNGKIRQTIPAGKQLDNSMFHSVYAASDGTLWAGSDGGIMTIHNKNIKTFRSEDGLTDEKIFCFYEDNEHNMWVGTQEGGIIIIGNGKIRTISRKEGLSDNLILCLYKDAVGSMWVGTGHDGLNRIDGKTGKISQLGPVLGYPQAITHIAEDNSGMLWLGTYFGVMAVKRSELDAYAGDSLREVKFSYFEQAEGMMPGGCTGGVFPAGCTMKDGKIWFSCAVGITEVDPENIRVPSYSPQVILQDLIINNESMGVAPSYSIPAGAIAMEIQYTAPSFIMPDELNFRYKLEGYDHQWIEAKTRRSAFYNNLPPGDYTFHVQVMNHHRQWGEPTQLAKIHLNPYFYQTTWFLALCVLLVIIIFYLFLKYRLKQVREKELEHLVLLRTEEIRKLNDELEQKVIDRTAQLGATNAELEAFSYSVSHDLKAPVRRIEALIGALQEDYGDKLDTPAQDFLAKISESVGTMSLLIDELLKLSRIARQEIERTDVNLSSMSVKILEKLKGIYPDRNVTFTVQPDLVVDCDARLIQIALQNLLDNAWKYTGQKEFAEISITAELQDGKTVVVIHDNGIGFDMNHYNKLFTPFQRLHSDDQFTGTGIGLATVRRIIQKHGGAIWAESQPGSGTSFFFTLK